MKIEKITKEEFEAISEILKIENPKCLICNTPITYSNLGLITSTEIVCNNELCISSIIDNPYMNNPYKHKISSTNILSELMTHGLIKSYPNAPDPYFNLHTPYVDANLNNFIQSNCTIKNISPDIRNSDIIIKLTIP